MHSNSQTPLLKWKLKEYYITDELSTWAKEVYIDLDNLTEEDIFIIKMRFEQIKHEK